MTPGLSLLGVRAQPAPASWLVALLLGLAVTAFHALQGAALGQSVLMASFNWVFDFDTSRFVGGWCTAGADVARDLDVGFVPRHALSVATRPLCLALTALAGSPGAGLMLLAALCAGCVAMLAYGLAAAFCAAEVDRLLLALGYAVSIQPLMLGVIPETYGFALLGIGLHFLLLARHRPAGLGARTSAVVSLFLNLGFTVTNGTLNLLSSAVLAWARMPLRRWLRQELRVWLLGIGLLLLATLAALAVFAPGMLGLAGGAPQRVWWIINIVRGEAASLGMVLCSFFLYAAVGPRFTVLNLPAPDSHPMLDFRAFDFSAVGSAALGLWCIALLVSAVLAWRAPDRRRLLVVVACWMLANVALHWYWQYRGSVYLYGAHTSFALYAVLAMGYGAALQRGAAIAWAWRGWFFVLLLLSAVNNHGLYAEMIHFLRLQPLTP